VSIYLGEVLFECGLFDEGELLEGALFDDGRPVDDPAVGCDGLEKDVELHVELSVPGPHPTVGVGVDGVIVDRCDI
jgi:hypothetical protein